MKHFIQMAVAAGALLLPSVLFAQESTTNSSSSISVGGAKSSSENLFKNGDFSREKTGWRTHGKVVDIDSSRKALEIQMDSRDAVSSTVLRPDSKTKHIIVKFKVKATEDGINGTPIDFEVEGRLFNRKEDLYYYYPRSFKKSGDWQEAELKYDVSQFCTDILFELIPKSSKGSLYITDFVATESK